MPNRDTLLSTVGVVDVVQDSREGATDVLARPSQDDVSSLSVGHTCTSEGLGNVVCASVLEDRPLNGAVSDLD